MFNNEEHHKHLAANLSHSVEKDIITSISELTNTQIKKSGKVKSTSIIEFILPQEIFEAEHIYGFLINEREFTVAIEELKYLFYSSDLKNIKKALIGVLVSVYNKINEDPQSKSLKDHIIYGRPYTNKFHYAYSLFKKNITSDSLDLSAVINSI